MILKTVFNFFSLWCSTKLYTTQKHVDSYFAFLTFQPSRQKQIKKYKILALMKRVSLKKLVESKHLFDCGFSLRKMEQRLKISKSLISSYLDKEGLKLSNKGGSPKKISDKLQKVIIRDFKNGVLKNSTDAQKYLANTHKLIVSNQTIRNILKKGHGKSRVKHLKPFLKLQHKKARLKFARLMIEKPFSFWESTVFTDESKYNLYGPDGNKRVWVFSDAVNLDHQVRQKLNLAVEM